MKAAGIEAGSELLIEIECISEKYELEKKNGPPKLGDVRRRLSKCKGSLDEALKEIATAGQWAHSQLAGLYRLRFRKLRVDIEAIQHLSGEIGKALEQVPSMGGRPPFEAQDMLFLELIKLYERWSGREFTYPDKREQFRGSDFVRKVAMMIEPTLSDTECRYRMRVIKFGDLLRKP